MKVGILLYWHIMVKVQQNSPIYWSKGSTDRNPNAYQAKIYETIEDLSKVSNLSPVPFDFELKDFDYGNDDELYFKTDHYDLPKDQLHKTTQAYEEDDIVLSTSRLREAPSTKSEPPLVDSSSLPRPVTLLSGPVQDRTAIDFGGDPSKTIYNHFVWYKAEMEDGKVGYVASNNMLSLGQRISGRSRYDTAVAISQEGWPETTKTVVLARGDDFPDALAGTPLAHQLEAPMLLTQKDKLTASTKEEIERLAAEKVIILGSSNAVSNKVSDEIKSMGIEVVRYGGRSRSDTAAIIADKLPNKGDTAILAYGMNYPDALSIAPYAAKNGYPIYLSLEDKLPKATADKISSYDNVIVVGSTGVINEKALKGISNYKRYGGHDRYDTNLDIIKNLPLGKEQAYFATGTGYADALTGAVLAAKNDAPLVLSPPTKLPESTISYLEKSSYDQFNLLGGDNALDVEEDLSKVLLTK